MRVSQINNNSYSQHFTSTHRMYPAKSEQGIPLNSICAVTWLFRSDIDWESFAKLIDTNFKDKDKVKIYSLACSDGTEPYTMAISIMENVPKKRWDKFFPIIASDKDNIIINAAKSGRINLSKIDLQELKNHINSTREYFRDESKAIEIEGDPNCKSKIIHSYQPVKKLKNAVSFEQSDMLKQIYRIRDNGNTVVLCRNATPYLTDNYRQLLAQAMKKQLKPGSLLVLGYFDSYSDFRDLLLKEENGMRFFEEIEKNIYRRRDIDSKDMLGVTAQYDTNKCCISIGDFKV